MTLARSHDPTAPARALAWRRAMHAAVCDELEPWAHGTVVRARRYPTYYDLNVVRVEDDPAMDVDALVAFADAALADADHRVLDFECIEAAEPLRADFAARGWKTMRTLWMRHETGARPARPAASFAVEPVDYDVAHALRAAWLRADFPDSDPEAHLSDARDVAMGRRVQVLAVLEAGVAIAFAQLERVGAAAEITHVYVRPDRRGGGRGTLMTRAAIEAAGDVEDLWITADDEDRPKELYARLGFRAVVTTMEFLRLP